MIQAVRICGHGVEPMLICLQVMFSSVLSPATLPFSIHLHFYCRTDLKWIFLADSTGVCKNESDVLGSSLYL